MVMNARTRQGRLIGANEWTGRPSLELEFFYAEGEGFSENLFTSSSPLGFNNSSGPV